MVGHQIFVGNGENAIGDVGDNGAGTVDARVRARKGEMTVVTETSSCVLDDRSKARPTAVASRRFIHVCHLDTEVVIAVTGLAIAECRNLAAVLRY